MASNLRAVPQAMPPSPQQQGWVWNGTQWVCDPCCDADDFRPFPCPPAGFPTPCPPWFPPPSNQPPWYPGANGGVSFSATPPPNPIRGAFWWDGTMLHLFDGAVWVNIGPSTPGSGGGTFVGTSPPASPAIGTTWWNGTIFQVWDGTKWELVGPPAAGGTTALEFAIQQPSPATVGADSAHWTPIPLTATPSVDLQSAWNSGSLRYTPKIAGYYQFQGRSLNASLSTAGLAIAKNDPGTYGGLSSDITVSVSSVASGGWMNVVGIAQMNGSTDYVRIWAYNTTGSVLGIGVNNALGAFLLP